MQLEVGMVLYCESSFPPSIAKYFIDRVTPKRAYVGNTEFDREQKHERFGSRGSNSWDSPIWQTENEEIIARYKRYILEKRFQRITIKNLADHQLSRIVAIANEVQP
jgi:hypothetical protein